MSQQLVLSLLLAALSAVPYGAYFLLEEGVAIVIALLHMHRHPDTWRSR